MVWLIIILVALLVAAALALTRLQTLLGQRDAALRELQQRLADMDAIRERCARAEADLQNERKNVKVLQDAEARLKLEFENLANRIFEEKGRTFSEQNRVRLDDLLKPFREQLAEFRQRVDTVHRDETEGLGRLLAQVKQLQELNNRLTLEAGQLVDAIKGESKTQGDWGEFIIQRIFEVSGLTQGRDYEAQPVLNSGAGDGARKQRPDFIVYLPGEKAVIVDSKVSLTDYEWFCRETDPAQKEKALKAHVDSVRKHVAELKQKAYPALMGNRTLDFVIMCVPLEPAYQLAMMKEPQLIQEEAGKTVVLTGPTTLMLCLRLIAQIWRRENENRHAITIAEKAGQIYDQAALVAETMVKADQQLKTTQGTFDKALNQLSQGKGNLVKRVEDIRKLGAKAGRAMPDAVKEKALADADDDVAPPMLPLASDTET